MIDGIAIAAVLALLFVFVSSINPTIPGSNAITGHATLEAKGHGANVEYIHEQDCYDSDNYNGQTPAAIQVYTKGHVSSEYYEQQDVCGSKAFANHVYEQICESTGPDTPQSPGIKIFECPGGTTCMQGECR